MAEHTTSSTTAAPTIPDAPATGGDITAATFTKMLDVLANLRTHTHTYYDDYTSACNCNCNCTCTRGIL